MSKEKMHNGCPEKVSFWIGDTFLANFLLFPLMVFYWRGIWDLVGVYIFPDDELRKNWTIFGIGCGTMFGYALHPLVRRGLHRQSRVTVFIVKRIYMGLFAVFPMAYWRAVWSLADYYLEQYEWKGGIIGYFICEVVLHVCRVRQTAIFPPLFVALDTRREALNPSTRFGIKPGPSWKYAGDALFSHFIALTFTILLWRGGWVCVDHFFFPDDRLLSDGICLAVGYGSVLVIMFMDPLFMGASKRIAKKHEHSIESHRFLALLAWEDFVYLVAFWAHLFLWRGAWNLNAHYIIEDIELGGWVNNIIGTVGFLVCQTYSYVGASGCAVDGWSDGTQERMFATQYLRFIVPFLKNCGRNDQAEDKQDSVCSKDQAGVDNMSYDNKMSQHEDNSDDDTIDHHTSHNISTIIIDSKNHTSRTDSKYAENHSSINPSSDLHGDSCDHGIHGIENEGFEKTEISQNILNPGTRM